MSGVKSFQSGRKRGAKVVGRGIGLLGEDEGDVNRACDEE